MNLFTSVEIGKMKSLLGYSDQLLLMGSCFVSEIGLRLQDAKFNCQVNPFGVLYNPMSIATSLRMLLENSFPTRENFFSHEGLWHSYLFHGDFSAPTLESLQENIHRSLDACHDVLKQISCLFITFGSAYVYELKETGQVVANCHKLPEKQFNRRRLSQQEIVHTYTDLLQAIWQVNPACRVLFTVSPIRHIRDGLHANQLSKATLLLAIDELLKDRNPECRIHYFPAYEIVLDELRDYRYFDEKMTHPTSVAVDVVWERFQHATMHPAVRQQAHYNMKQHKLEKHIPLHPSN